PCKEPIPYTIGTFDTQFGISKDYFLSALSDAEAIWEKPKGDYAGKNLFVYEPTDTNVGDLKINLVYDYRQQATSKLASLGITVKDNRASYDELKAKFTSLKAQYDTEKINFEAHLQAFNQKELAYEAEVKSWNAKGGAPQAEYDRLQNTRTALDVESKQLQAEQAKVNAMVDEINALVVALNRLIATLNLSVEKYNTVNTSRGESFEEGVYVSDGGTQHIDIYEFSSRAKLVRVLAHELGHALGLEHVDDPKAIMYKLNQGSNETLTSADLQALKTKCGMK
ncbi:MAG TPA: matrixin family metalloprotease, partial [Candidatus Paceibacterota bacterium]|nr:matrixin family metalloprotease [Candidatus Paceibacterota bacterium]